MAEVSFNDYINNPGGKGSAVVTNRGMYKSMYQQKFDAVLLREQGKIEYKVYHKNDSFDTYFIHIKIPSEELSGFYYDTVIKLYTGIGSKKSATNLKNYAVQFYSNDATFVFTYVYAFSKNKLFINELSSKMSKQALKERAKVRNPRNEIGYIKSLYFAYLTMDKYNLFERTVLDKEAKDYNKLEFLKAIAHSDEKMEERRAAKAKDKEDKKKEKPPAKQEDRNAGVATNTSKRSAITKTVSTSKKTKKVSTTKTTKVTSMNKNK